tara:strand:- start:1211 stop:1666 length:456 start_codon:yes stop_codon:yes gene_type:complete
MDRDKEVIIWNSEETGHIAITIVAQGCPLSDEEIIAKDVPTKNFKVIKRTEIDKLDQRFVPNAFICDENMNPVVDLKKAKEVWRDRIRIKRVPVLQALDVEYLKASEKNEDTSEITEKKQQLRDLPQSSGIDKAKSIEDLTKVWHNLLGEK